MVYLNLRPVQLQEVLCYFVFTEVLTLVRQKYSVIIMHIFSCCYTANQCTEGLL